VIVNSYFITFVLLGSAAHYAALRQVQCRRHAGVKVLSGLRRMSVFGGGCLNVWSEGLPSAESPRSPSPPQGHLRCSKVCWPDLDRCGLGGGFPRSPLEARAVDPDAMEDNGDFAGNGHLGLLGTDPLHLPDAPSFQSRPALGSMKQHTCRLEQVAPQQSVARLGYPFGPSSGKQTWPSRQTLGLSETIPTSETAPDSTKEHQ
jgi:hypothetical protein